MRVLIGYYSLSGNTEKAAERLAQCLEEGATVTLQRIEPLGRFNPFHIVLALLGGKVPIQPIDAGGQGYDIIFIGSPVWAGCPVPAVNAFIDSLTFDGTVNLFVTCESSGEGAVGKMSSRLSRRGVKTGEATVLITKGSWLEDGKIDDLAKKAVRAKED